MALYKIIFFVCNIFLNLTAKHAVNLSTELQTSKILIPKSGIKDQSGDLLDKIHSFYSPMLNHNQSHNLIANLHIQNDIVEQHKSHNDLILLNNFLKKQVNPEYQKALQILNDHELYEIYRKKIESIRDELLTMSAQIIKKDILIDQTKNKNKNLSLQIPSVKTLSVNNANSLPSKKKNLLHLLSTG